MICTEGLLYFRSVSRLLVSYSFERCLLAELEEMKESLNDLKKSQAVRHRKSISSSEQMVLQAVS